MFDQTQRSLWLEEQLWPKLREAFSTLQQLPREALITVGYPSSGARGRNPKRYAEVNQLWQGNENEKVFIGVPPISWKTPADVAAAIVVGAAKVAGGIRWGAYREGFRVHKDGTLEANAEATAKIKSVLADIGEPPAGYGVPFPVRTVQRTRLRRYACAADCESAGEYVGKHPVIRAASDTLDVACNVCGNKYVKE